MISKIFRMQLNSLGPIRRSAFTNSNQSKWKLPNKRIVEPVNTTTQNSSVVLSKQPNLIYVQNPFTWLRNKVRLRLLRYTWDHDFEEKEFKRGATQVKKNEKSDLSQNLQIFAFLMFLCLFLFKKNPDLNFVFGQKIIYSQVVNHSIKISNTLSINITSVVLSLTNVYVFFLPYRQLL